MAAAVNSCCHPDQEMRRSRSQTGFTSAVRGDLFLRRRDIGVGMEITSAGRGGGEEEREGGGGGRGEEGEGRGRKAI